MKTLVKIFSIVSFGLMLLSSSAMAQSVAPFEGRGIKDDQGSAPNWFGSSGSTKPKSDSPGWFGQGIMRSASQGEVENRPGFFSSLIQRPSNEPSLMQRAGDRSREFVDRTRNWALEKNEALKMRTSSSWDTLTQGLRPIMNSGKESIPAPFGGANRIAENPDATRTEKF